VTKTGKPRYYFAREPKAEPVEEIPEGYVIWENVNGLVYLTRERESQILPEERSVVDASVKKHPKARNYRVDVKGKRIIVYESVGPDIEDLEPLLRGLGGLPASRLADLQAHLDKSARFSPVMRFTLLDEQARTFQTERWCYLGSIDDWIDIGPSGPLRRLARKFIRLLGSDALFDVFL
jgi:hypothetical protein